MALEATAPVSFPVPKENEPVRRRAVFSHSVRGAESQHALSPDDAAAIRTALAVFDAPLAAKHLAPLADCCTFLLTGQVPPDSPLPPTARADLALLHVVS